MTLLTGFEPVIDKNCRVLILGSMPGAASLQKHQYYAHPRNAFWPIMEDLFGIKKDKGYNEHCALLSASGVGVWDVLKQCKRTGSLDSSIRAGSEQVNDFEKLFTGHTAIRAVFFNGGTAERLYKINVLSSDNIHYHGLHYHRLPSTSPAYASMSYQEKARQWRSMLDYLAI